MTRKQAAQLWPIIKAFGEGKIIEVNSNYTGWTEIPEPQFNEGPRGYRIKPEPHLRPWKPEEVPVGALTRCIPHTDDNSRQMILWVGDNMPEAQVTLSSMKGHSAIGMDMTFENLLARYEHSLNHGVTWKPCGVEE